MTPPPHYYYTSSCVRDKWDGVRRRRTQLLSSLTNNAPTLCCSNDGEGFQGVAGPDCLSRRSFAEAKATCHSVGLRLCSKQELQGGTCSFFDNCKLPAEERVWSSTTETNLQIKHHTHSCVDEATHRRPVVKLLSHVNDEANVLCCSYADGKCEQGCLPKQSFAQGEASCQAAGHRLCTKLELESGPCCGAGYCKEEVWSSTTEVSACCTRHEAECLACMKGLSEKDYCSGMKSAHVPGCEGAHYKVDEVAHGGPSSNAHALFSSPEAIILFVLACLILPVVVIGVIRNQEFILQSLQWCFGPDQQAASGVIKNRGIARPGGGPGAAYIYHQPGIRNNRGMSNERIMFNSRDIT